MKLRELSYKTEFFWEGVRYTQVIRPKFPLGKFIVVCRPSRDQGKWVDMPANREVKPVLTLQEFRN